MMKSITLTVLALVASTSAFVITFDNKCSFTVWPAVAKAPNGQPDPSVAFGDELDAGLSTSFTVDDSEIGIRAWGRTGCDSTGANCATGNCVGGLICTDGGITAGVLLSEFGAANFGAFGGNRISWDLSIVDASINIGAQMTTSDGQTATCTQASCTPDQAFTTATDFAADKNSPVGTTFVHTFCP